MSTFVEHRTIDVIPSDERTGRPRDLFSIWFAANIGPLTILTGGLPPVIYGLDFWWSIIALLAGQLLGGLFMALHSAQGPRLGIPQMIQSRGQFGVRGCLVILVVVLVMYEGIYAANIVSGAQSVHAVFPSLPLTPLALVFALVGLVVMLVGYRLIHLIGHIITAVSITSLALVIAGLVIMGRISADVFALGVPTVRGFLGTMAIGALWLLAFAPYVSDYSRYMPAHTAGLKSTFWWTYGGALLGGMIPMGIGVIVAISVKGDALTGLPAVLGEPLSTIVLFSFAAVIMHFNAMNLYGATLTVVTMVQTFRSDWLPTARGRAAIGGLLVVLATAGAALMSQDFLNSFTNLIIMLQYVFIPWTAVNLIDFYLIRKGDYAVADLFRADGGRYGRYDTPALVAYTVGVLVEIPFMSTALYIGPVADLLAGADISWIVSLAITIPLYLALARRRLPRAQPAWEAA
ncbi:NCS1 family nucleobase:cation symporter-1 [Nonomuraea fuscirosea]|uniref:NCS1 family nucleobase:cation symporter-1 n=1 Tax=Nonomuraea fuscirosea TaxID=1291556 RepID=A0A2T0LXK9_9ACTN|nr:cytosine permease [Nonomuraea fuscirosea]PRX48758.1 NCS1 family nucleobase:cation symporter-1 [Nonomuraea fuscirosea]